MNPMGVISSGIQGITGIASGIIGSKKRKNEEKAAQAQYDRKMKEYENMDTSNPYADMENVYEDATVNQQESQMIAQQQQQGMANTMDQFSGAAGGSGIAALAQAMAGQQSQNAQTAAASIGNQEQSIQQAERGEASRLQGMEAKGEIMSREAEMSKLDSTMQMSQQRLGAAKDARAAATQSLMSGVTSMGDAAMQATPAGALSKISDRRLKKNIKLIGKSPSGLKIYAFEYINKMLGKGTWQGVMSDEIPQNAIVKHKDGYDRVNYSKLDVEFKQI